MKKIFLAFSIVFSFAFAWAQTNPGSEPNEAKRADGATSTAIGADTANCVQCRKNTWQGPRDKNTNPDSTKSDGSGSDTGGSKNTK